MTTPREDLRTGTSVWEASAREAPDVAPLSGDAETDVLIVGAGVSGAMTAEALASEGVGVLVVDRRGVARGSTAASTSLLQQDLDTPLMELEEGLGVERARRVWKRSRLAVDAIRDRLSIAGLSHLVGARDTLYLEGDRLSARGLERETEVRRCAGFACEWLSASETRERYGVADRAALLNSGSLAADPIALTLAFHRLAMDRGAKLHASEEIVDVVPSGDHVRARTASGRTVRAGCVVFATGYEVAHGVPTRGHEVVSTWAFATAPQPGRLWRSECFIWEASDPYLYIRTSPEGRVICGGEDEPFDDESARDALIPEKTQVLQEKLARLLPWLDVRAEYAWAANFGSSERGTPSIGAVPGMDRCYAILGFGGNGMTFSMMGAQMVCAAILGRTDEDAELFAFERQEERTS